jgi:hypothetical protein
VYAIVQLDDKNESILNPLLSGDYSKDKNLTSVYLNSTISNTNSMDIVSNDNVNLSYPSLIPFSLSQLDYWDDEWLSRYNIIFSPTYKVAEFILKDSKLEVNRSLSSNCYSFKYNSCNSGYGSVNNNYLSQAAPNQGILHSDLGATNACRIVAMACRPEYEWIVRRDGVPGLETHHTCFNRSCVNPLHLQPLSITQHRQLHAFVNRVNGKAIESIIATPSAAYAAGISSHAL